MGVMLLRGTKLACNIMDGRWHGQYNIAVTMSYLRIWWSWLRTYCTSCTGHNHPSPARNPCCSPSDLQQHIDSYYTTSKRYSTITSIKFPSFCKVTFNASIINRPPQSHDCSCYLNIRILACTPLWLQKHADLQARDFTHSSLVTSASARWLHTPEAGDFVELILI